MRKTFESISLKHRYEEVTQDRILEIKDLVEAASDNEGEESQKLKRNIH